MTFGNFCEYLQKIEATPKRLEITSLLSKLLKRADADEVDKVVMLALGRIAPLYKSIEFSLAEKMIIRAIAQTAGVSPQIIKQEFKNNGDLGETAAKFQAPCLAGRRASSKLPASPAGGQVPSPKLSVTEVFNRLLDIAGQSGEKSQERKLAKTADLLHQLNPLGAKYAVRIILGNLRLGFSDKTVLDALSVIIAGDKSAREKLEQTYNVRPDVGWLAAQVQSSKFKVQSLRPEPELGTPILPALCQRLPTAEEIIAKMGETAVEPKWDGQRLQAHICLKPQLKVKSEKLKVAEIHLFTRSLEDVTEMFPDLVKAFHSLIQHSTFKIQNCILDGEIVAVDPKTGRVLPFQTMITRKRKYGIREKLAAVPVKYMVFDILYLNGRSLMGEPFIERRKILEKLLDFRKTRKTQKTGVSEKPENQKARSSGIPNLRLSDISGSPSFPSVLEVAPQIVTSNPGEIRKFLKQQIDSGLEGIVAKRSDAPYIPGRTKFAWVKLKWEGAAKSGGLLDTVDCVIMGTYRGRGKRAGFGVGAFLVGVLSNLSDLKYLTISKIGTGLTDEQWRELKVKSQKLKVKSQPKEYEVPKELAPDTWLRPELVAEIQADNITKSPLHSAGYALRFPRLVRYRSDKNPDQATTLAEVKKLYEMQGKTS